MIWLRKREPRGLLHARDRAGLLAQRENSIVGTSVTPLFARSPLVLASAAADVQAIADGRFVLSEVRRHILETPVVHDAHDLHAWTITSGLLVLSVRIS